MKRTILKAIALLILIPIMFAACNRGAVINITPSPEPSASTDPTREPTSAPTGTPTSGTEPTETPVSGSPEPTKNPSPGTPEPTESTEPTKSPDATKKPDENNTPKPTTTPEKTTTPTPAPTANTPTPSPTSDPESDGVVKVTVNKSKKLFASGFQLGSTHTHYFWEKGSSNAVSSARDIFNSFSDFNNQHIMGWGAGNPWESKNGPMNFSSLDARINLLKSLSGEPMITFCTAPGWMKGTDDWAMEEDVLDQYIDDFAYLCARIAERYKDVRYFQVWNEFKGYWNSRKNAWDYERYTTMYNAVYTEVKKVRPDAKVGGFYMVIEGDASRELLGVNGTHDYTPLTSFQKTAIKYWLNNKAGADFICIDKGLRDYHNDQFYPTPEQTMVLSTNFEKVIRELTELTDLPVIMSEFYGYIDKGESIDRTLDAAQYAAMYRHLIMGSGGRDMIALLWIEKQNDLPGSLFSDTNRAGGGQPFKHAEVAQAIKQYFSKGHDIVEAYASSDKVFVLASKEKIMIINTRSTATRVRVNYGEEFELSPFEVVFIDH